MRAWLVILGLMGAAAACAPQEPSNLRVKTKEGILDYHYPRGDVHEHPIPPR